MYTIKTFVAHIFTALLLLCVLFVEKIETADVTADEVETALKGVSEVVLPCVTTPGAGTKVKWEKSTGGSTDKIITYTIEEERVRYGSNYKNQTDMYDIAVDENNEKKQLRIRNPTASQSGLYVCTILGGPTNPTYRVELQVLVPPEQSQFSITVDDTVYAGSDTQVTCTVTNISPGKDKTQFAIYVGATFNKRSGDNDISEEENADGTFDLTYSPKVKIEKDYNGKDIACVIYWMEEDTTIYKTLTVRKTIEVYYPPTRVDISSPGGTTVEAGADMRFNCATDEGNPLPRLYVAKKMVDIPDYKDANAADFSVRLTKQDNGLQFQCRVRSSTNFFTYNFLSTSIIRPNVQFSATKVTFDAPTTMTDGSKYDIRCTSDAGNPDPEIRFNKNGVQGTVTPSTIPGWYNATKAVRTLSITATRGMNGKKIECYLQNNRNIKNETTLKVIYAPTQVRITATSASVRENTEMSFQCATNGGNPPPKLRIEKRLANGSMTPVSQYGTVAKILVRLTKNDNGLLFFCRAKSSDNSVLDYDTLPTTGVTADVRFDASRVVIEDNIPSSKGGLLEEGEEHEITCRSNEGNPAPVINYNTNGILGTSLMTQSNVEGYYNAFKANRVLKLTQVTREMNGKSIECYLENPNNVKTMYKLNVTFAPNGVGIQVAPVIKVGEKYNVTCLSNTANPVSEVGMKITWNGNSRQYNNQNITIAGTYNGRRREFVYSLKAKKEDHGHDMTCQALWGSKTVSPSKKITLNIYFPPVININLGEKYINHVIEGQDLALTCETKDAGNPTTYTYQWKYKTKLIANQAGSEYRMQHIEYTDAGTYICVASNYEGGTATADKTVVVFYAAKSLKDNIQVFYAEQEQRITLSFNFTLLPYDDVQVDWIFNNGMINDTVDKHSVTTTKIKDKIHQTKYTITTVKDTHFGTYFIKIRNNQVDTQLKVAEFNITFELKGKPVAPDNLLVNSTSPTSLNVTWKVQRDGGSPQTFIVEYWREGEEGKTMRSLPLKAKKLHATQSYEITGLVANKQYQVQVKTETMYGGGSSATSESYSQKTQSEPGSGLLIGLGVVLTLVVLAVLLVLGLVFGRKHITSRRGKGASAEESIGNGTNYSKVNTALISPEVQPEDVEYAVVDKTKKTKKKPIVTDKPRQTNGSETQPLVRGSPKDDAPPVQETVEYAVVNKPKKKPVTAPLKKHDGKPVVKVKPTRKAGNAKPPAHLPPPPPEKEEEQTYENFQMVPTKQNEKKPPAPWRRQPPADTVEDDDNVYANVDSRLPTQDAPPVPQSPGNNNKAEPGLIYADLTFDHVNPQDGVHAYNDGEEPVTYSTVDFGKLPAKGQSNSES